MLIRRRRWLLLLLLLAGPAGLAYVYRGPLSLQLMQRVADQRLAEQPLADLLDGLHVGLCGAGSPFPDEQRGSPCTLVIAGKQLFVIDAGTTAAANINRMHFSPGQIDALFLTHFHSDHIGGLGELMLQRWGTAAQLTAVLEHSAAKAGRANLAKVFGDIVDYHGTPEQAAQIARDAGVGMLLFNHIVPALPLPGMQSLFLGDAPQIFSGPIKVGTDGDFVSLPAGSKAIELSSRI